MPQSLLRNHKTLDRLCKQCKKRRRVTLYFCQPCRESHNKQTRKLKRKYRAENRCVMCGELSGGSRRCKTCVDKNYIYVINSPWLKSKKSKKGIFGNINEIMRLI